MKPVDRHILNRLEPFAKAFVTDDQWLLVEKAVEDADGVLNTSGTVRDIIEKASFNSRSEAARYAAEQRWKGHKPTTRRYSGTAGKTEPASTVSEPTPATKPQKEKAVEKMSLDELKNALSEIKTRISAAEAKGEPTTALKQFASHLGEFATRKEKWHAQIPEADLSTLSRIIQTDIRMQGKKVPFGAKPYLDAMGALSSVNDNYGMDSGRSIVAYALSNLGGYSGDTAKLIKAELKKRMASVTPTGTASSSGDRFYVGKPYEGDKGFAVGGEPYTGDKGFWI